jgi:glutamyl-tRNA reductase
VERGIILVGLNHQTAPVEIREQVAFGNGILEPALQRLVELKGVAEGAILSTCNRVEVIACGSDPLAVGAVLPSFLAREHGVAEATLAVRRSGTSSVSRRASIRWSSASRRYSAS